MAMWPDKILKGGGFRNILPTFSVDPNSLQSYHPTKSAVSTEELDASLRSSLRVTKPNGGRGHLVTFDIS